MNHRKVFLDVGAFNGDTVEMVLSPQLGLTDIWCFEPAPSCFQFLKIVYGNLRRVHLADYGLWDRTETKPLYAAGSQAGSVFADYAPDGKNAVRGPTAYACRFVDVADWFTEHLLPDDEVVMKINCEGCECDILQRLIQSGQIHRVKFAFVAWDVNKVPGQERKEQETRQMLQDARYWNLMTWEGPTAIRAAMLREAILL